MRRIGGRGGGECEGQKKGVKKGLWLCLLFPVFVVFVCEFAIFYPWIYFSSSPLFEVSLLEPSSTTPTATTTTTTRVLLVSDVHMLGLSSVWVDRVRREWAMERGFKSALSLFSPDIVLILGDVMDEVIFYCCSSYFSYLGISDCDSCNDHCSFQDILEYHESFLILSSPFNTIMQTGSKIKRRVGNAFGKI